MNDQQKHYQVIPDGEFRCVWMSAGILSYQLCDRSFDCEHCPLDVAMRQHFARPQSSGEAEIPTREPSIHPEDLPEDLRYTATHCWVKPITPMLYRVGIEAGLAHALMVPGTVILPPRGEKIETSKPCAWFVLESKTVPLLSFTAGELVSINTLLTERPYKIYFHPYDQGWLFDVLISEGTYPALMDARTARVRFEQDQHLFRERVRSALQDASHGQTLHDGGETLRDLSLMLGPDRYFELVKEIFLNKKIS